jgi:phage terminase small subunit
MKGRPTIPAANKKARGNPGRRPMPKEPKSEQVMPPMPKFKNPQARIIWKRDTPEYYNAGLITKLSVSAWLWMFERIDFYFSTAKEAAKEKRRGIFPAGTFRIMDKAWGDVLNARRGFGGDPSSLSKVFAGTKDEEANPFADFEVIQGGRK